MTEQEAKEKPIHEVVKALNTVSDRNDTWGGRRDSEIEEETTMLRCVLLQRCDNHRFEYLMPSNDNKDGWVEWHKEMSAFHAFWAWELEQRRKEQEGGSND